MSVKTYDPKYEPDFLFHLTQPCLRTDPLFLGTMLREAHIAMSIVKINSRFKLTATSGVGLMLTDTHSGDSIRWIKGMDSEWLAPAREKGYPKVDELWGARDWAHSRSQVNVLP